MALICHPPMIEMLSIFHICDGHLCIAFRKLYVHIICPFLKRLFGFLSLNYFSSLHVLKISLLSDDSMQIFIPLCRFSHKLIVSSVVQFFHSMHSYLLIFPLVACAFTIILKNIFLAQCWFPQCFLVVLS